MSRRAVVLSCTDNEKQLLEKWANGAKIEKRLHLRAQIILAWLEGKTNLQVAQQLAVSRFTVAKWRTRFACKRLSGLVDNPRAGKPRKYGREIRDKILKTLEIPPPIGQSTWDGASLAAAVGASDQAVWKILQKRWNSITAIQKLVREYGQGIFSEVCRYYRALFESTRKRSGNMCRRKTKHPSN